MRKNLLILSIALFLAAIKLIASFALNESFISKYQKNDYNPENVQGQLLFNWPEPYVKYYNYANTLYHNKDYLGAVDSYNKALTYNPPDDKECAIRINIALALLKQIKEDDSSLENIDTTLEVLSKAKEELFKHEDGCAHREDSNGHNATAEQLKADIEKKEKELEDKKDQLQDEEKRKNESPEEREQREKDEQEQRDREEQEQRDREEQEKQEQEKQADIEQRLREIQEGANQERQEGLDSNNEYKNPKYDGKKW